MSFRSKSQDDKSAEALSAETMPAEDSTTNGAFQIWPVLDLMNGDVVRGVAGNRAAYRPMEPESRPVNVVANLCSEFESAFSDIYIADLDALQGQAIQTAAIGQLCAAFPEIHYWIDAGFASPVTVQQFCEGLGNAMQQVSLIVATETLESWTDMASIVETCPVPVSLSLDLVDGAVRAKHEAIANESPHEIVARAVGLGVRDVIVLDVAKVGIRSGVSTLELCGQILERNPRLRLVTGGGVRTIEDLKSIQGIGCHAALVATALHEKTVTCAELVERL